EGMAGMPRRDATHAVLDRERDRAERMLNRARGVVLLLLALSALAYAPSLTPALNRMNVVVLLPMLAWTFAQNRMFYRRPRLPEWLGVVNPIADIAAVTAILGAYAVANSAQLALKTPIFLAYFVILASLPVAASTRKAALVASLAFAAYAGLVTAFVFGGHVQTVLNPVTASTAAAISPLDEGAKLLLLAIAGGVATYATRWQEKLAMRVTRAADEREQLEARLARAQLQSLRLQLQPHFLFNTLNTITALITAQPRTAERVVSGLSELLRMSLSDAGAQEVTLERELEMLEHYVAIQRVRFADRLTVRFDVAPGVREAMVPNLVLQPLVENAIRHGIAPRARQGHVVVTANRRDDVLVLRVEDDGVGEDPGAPHPDGVGLGNTRARLWTLYGDAHRFEARGLSHGSGGGMVTRGGFAVDIELPFREAGATAGVIA
ncbi:MAG TPA: histidine kinase, partial [Gemmatimonadaceae bacterium]|nr:histidine kinase [Gemmatimonadaceae bacterium]